jgi:hypothetical protein
LPRHLPRTKRGIAGIAHPLSLSLLDGNTRQQYDQNQKRYLSHLFFLSPAIVAGIDIEMKLMLLKGHPAI